MEPLKLAVIGVGALGRHHARILSQMPGVELVAVADPDVAQAPSVAESCGCEWTPDYRTVLQRIDAASVVVPTSLHKTVASEFLRRNIPVLVEKPLASTAEEGRTLVRLADEHRIPLQVGHIERFNPAFQRLAESAGEPKYIRAERLSPYAFRSMDIGAVHDLMIHDLDLVLTLVGSRVERVEAFGISIVGGREDCAQARLTFANGCIADLTANRVCPTFCRTLQVWSESGCINADLHRREVTTYRPGEALLAGELPFELAQRSGADIAALKSEMFERFIVTETLSASNADALTAELSSFVDAVRHHRRPVVDGAQALAALDVAERILACVGSHAWDGAGSERIGPHAHQIHQQQKSAA